MKALIHFKPNTVWDTAQRELDDVDSFDPPDGGSSLVWVFYRTTGERLYLNESVVAAVVITDDEEEKPK